MAMVTKMEMTMKKKEIMKAVDVVVEAVELDDSNLMNREKRDVSKESTFQFEKLWYLKSKSKHSKPWLGHDILAQEETLVKYLTLPTFCKTKIC